MKKLDVLNRDKFVDNLLRVMENISDNKASTCFALNGIWGSGKSFVLDMFEEKLSEIQSEETSTDKYFIVRSYASCKSTCGSQPRFRNFLDDKRNLTSGAYPKLEVFSGIS